MIIGISATEVVKKVCGGAALRSFMSQGYDREIPPILTRDRRKALELMLDDVMSYTLLGLFPNVAGYRRDGDLHLFELTVEGWCLKQGNIGLMIETAVVSRMLSLIFAGIDREFADHHTEIAKCQMSALRERFADALAASSPQTVK